MEAVVNETLHNGSASLYTTLYRRPSAETIVLLHGGPGVPDDMTEICDFLSPYYQVLKFEQRGSGRGINDPCTFQIQEYISDLEVIRKHYSLTRFHLFGHSWGGVYAQLYARVHSQNILSLFLCSPASGTGKIWTMAEREIFMYNYRRATALEWLGMVRDFVAGILGSKTAYRRLFRQLIINYHKGYNVDAPDDEKISGIGSRAGTLTRREIKKHPPIDSFGITPYPVLITYGEHDAYGKSREHQIARFPGARLQIIPSSGHTPWKHNLPYFQSLLRDFYYPPRRGGSIMLSRDFMNPESLSGE